MIKKNSYWIGILMGILFPAIIFGILYGLTYLTGILFHRYGMLTLHKMMFVSIALNVLPIRYYLISKGLENTGKGILIITLILILIVTVVL